MKLCFFSWGAFSVFWIQYAQNSDTGAENSWKSAHKTTPHHKMQHNATQYNTTQRNKTLQRQVCLDCAGHCWWISWHDKRCTSSAIADRSATLGLTNMQMGCHVLRWKTMPSCSELCDGIYFVQLKCNSLFYPATSAHLYLHPQQPLAILHVTIWKALRNEIPVNLTWRAWISTHEHHAPY